MSSPYFLLLLQQFADTPLDNAHIQLFLENLKNEKPAPIKMELQGKVVDVPLTELFAPTQKAIETVVKDLQPQGDFTVKNLAAELASRKISAIDKQVRQNFIEQHQLSANDIKRLDNYIANSFSNYSMQINNIFTHVVSKQENKLSTFYALEWLVYANNIFSADYRRTINSETNEAGVKKIIIGEDGAPIKVLEKNLAVTIKNSTKFTNEKDISKKLKATNITGLGKLSVLSYSLWNTP